MKRDKNHFSHGSKAICSPGPKGWMDGKERRKAGAAQKQRKGRGCQAWVDGGKATLLYVKRTGASELCRVQDVQGRRSPVGEVVNEAVPAGQDACKNFPSRFKG